MEHDPEGTKAALYVRVSTDKQTVANQIEALTAVALARGWEVVVDMRKNKIRPAPRPCRPPIAEVYKHALGCRYFVSRIAIYATLSETCVGAPATPPLGCGSLQTTTAAAADGQEQEMRIAAERRSSERQRDQSM